jgi:hypothetical protein
VLLLLDGTVSLKIAGVEFTSVTATFSDHSKPVFFFCRLKKKSSIFSSGSVRVVGTFSFVMREVMDFSVVANSTCTVRVLDRKTMEMLMEKVTKEGRKREKMFCSLCFCFFFAGTFFRFERKGIVFVLSELVSFFFFFFFFARQGADFMKCLHMTWWTKSLESGSHCCRKATGKKEFV